MAYLVRLRPRAHRELEGLPERDRERLLQTIEGLADNPRPLGTRKLRSRTPVWRLRVGSYRIVYAVFDPDELVIVGAVERRSERTYRDVNQLFR